MRKIASEFKIVKYLLILSLGAIFNFAVSDFTKSSAKTTEAINVSATPTPAPKPAAKQADEKAAESDDEVIRVNTELVSLHVRAVDRNNRPVKNLKQTDFSIFENEIPQQIDSFSEAEVPSDYALVIDNSGSLRKQIDKVIEAGKIIVNANRQDDNTSVVRFVSSDKIQVIQDFTMNKTSIDQALDNLFIEGGPTAIIDAVYLSAQKVDGYDRQNRGTDIKRRALILVSDGEDRDSQYTEEQLFDLLRESDVQIYTIGFINQLNPGTASNPVNPRAKAKSLLERLALETGGKSYFPSSTEELNDIAKDIAVELRSQYVISYYPTSEKSADAKNIKVTIADGSGGDNQKRIAITRTGRIDAGKENKPTLQETTQMTRVQ